MLKRFPHNPILKPKKENAWESKLVFSPAAVYHNGLVHLLYRAVGDDNISRIGYAISGFTEWNDWRWQLRHRLRGVDTLSRIFRLSEDEVTAIGQFAKQLPLAITSYYESLLDKENPLQPFAVW